MKIGMKRTAAAESIRSERHAKLASSVFGVGAPAERSSYRERLDALEEEYEAALEPAPLTRSRRADQELWIAGAIPRFRTPTQTLRVERG